LRPAIGNGDAEKVSCEESANGKEVDGLGGGREEGAGSLKP